MTRLVYGSVCSGIEAASVAWAPLGWEAAFFSEIEKFPCAVLAHHYPDVPNFGDMTKFKEWPDAIIDVLVGGTPCQSFSVAGLRKGLADPRGNLMLTYLAIAARYRPTWLVWENVPGVLSSWTDETDEAGNPTGWQTNDFDCFLAGLAEIGYGFAYRILDAQHFGVPQRRRRVFVVGHLGDWRRAAAVLFERHSLSGHPAPRRKEGEIVAGTIKGGSGIRGYPDPSDGNRGGLIDCTPRGIAGTVTRKWSKGSGGPAGDEHYNLIAPALNASMSRGKNGQDVEALVAHTLSARHDSGSDGCGRGTPIVPYLAPTLDQRSGRSGENSFATSGGLVPVAFAQNQRDEVRTMDVAGALAAEPGMKQQTYIAQPYTLAVRGRGDCRNLECRQDGTANALLTPNGGRDGIGVGAIAAPGHAVRQAGMQVRRLTPKECARLQGFPDDYLDIDFRGRPAADGPKYKALGNSFAVPVVEWIARRIALVEAVCKEVE